MIGSGFGQSEPTSGMRLHPHSAAAPKWSVRSACGWIGQCVLLAEAARGPATVPAPDLITGRPAGAPVLYLYIEYETRLVAANEQPPLLARVQEREQVSQFLGR